MQTVTTIAEVRSAVAAWHAAGARVAFVPTMGNLHAGHIHLVSEARKRADLVVASIFVNPLQFGQGEDFAAYPRTLAADQEKLTAAGCDLLFAPGEREMYPLGRDGLSFVEVPGLSDILCGAFRPGHFRGVATVVSKLFNIVRPDVALFGEKDYQQLLVIRLMVRDLDMDLEIVGVPTVREADGLAMSSRNGYLQTGERQPATELYATLQALAAQIRGGVRDYAALEAAATAHLEQAGFRPDYVSVRRAEDLGLPQMNDRRLVALAAARLGKTRLIDNLLIDLD
ncbi:MAG: pantoate--beta-alanine ligase [Gammaproteobacteria bacterium HGW-Gammaproteobacteria-1]|jgi:pantoate--beta-alanine ligase|nr:MAG: pantoate--beta-alanine ligase [Gammaproteobacteria bacterium HGW-Gammaproteobacteria-1]